MIIWNSNFTGHPLFLYASSGNPVYIIVNVMIFCNSLLGHNFLDEETISESPHHPFAPSSF